MVMVMVLNEVQGGFVMMSLTVVHCSMLFDDVQGGFVMISFIVPCCLMRFEVALG